MRSPSSMRRSLADALALVLPVSCAGCGEPDVGVCDDCRSRCAPVVMTQTVAGIPVHSGLVYEDEVAAIIRALKEDGRMGLVRDLAPAMAAAASRCGAEIFAPIPTSRSSFRARGFHVVDSVARRAGLPVQRLLRHSRQPGDQRGLDAEQRRRNVAGALAVRRAEPRRVALLDDVMTTGATLAEGIRALRAAGCDVVGAATIAATPKRSSKRRV